MACFKLILLLLYFQTYILCAPYYAHSPTRIKTLTEVTRLTRGGLVVNIKCVAHSRGAFTNLISAGFVLSEILRKYTPGGRSDTDSVTCEFSHACALSYTIKP